jgi:phosphoesterase RecJ-like protein
MTENSLKADITKLQGLVEAATTILVLQPEKPDTDSLGTSLALEQVFGDLDKTVVMYCQDEVPTYLRILDGWDRVTHDLPAAFDLTILVDCGGPQQLQRTLDKHQAKLTSKPFVILDHHKNREPMPFETINVIDVASAATGELVVIVCKQTGWKINLEAAMTIVPSIMADTLGLSTPTTTAQTVEAVAEMVRIGVDLYELRRRREMAEALEPEIFKLKGALIGRTEYFADGRIALVVVTPEELSKYADIHDPADLISQEMRRVKGVDIAIVMRNYNSTFYGRKIKVSMRANVPVAAKAAQHFGGGGHDQAAGCTIEGREPDDVIKEFIPVVTKLLDEHEAN